MFDSVSGYLKYLESSDDDVKYLFLEICSVVFKQATEQLIQQPFDTATILTRSAQISSKNGASTDGRLLTFSAGDDVFTCCLRLKGAKRDFYTQQMPLL